MSTSLQDAAQAALDTLQRLRAGYLGIGMDPGIQRVVDTLRDALVAPRLRDAPNEPIAIPPKEETMRNRFRDAITAQDACNISGLARSLVEMIDQARSEDVQPAEDPAVKLMVHQIAFLSIGEPRWDYGAALAECERRAQDPAAGQPSAAASPEAVVRALESRFNDRSGQTEIALVGELIGDLVANERFDNGGQLEEGSIDLLQSSLAELSDAAEAAQTEIRAQRRPPRSTGPGM